VIRKCASGYCSTYRKRVGRLVASTTIEKNGKVVEMQIDNDAVAPTKIVTLCQRRKTKE
jgi:hypothetical protein